VSTAYLPTCQDNDVDTHSSFVCSAAAAAAGNDYNDADEEGGDEDGTIIDPRLLIADLLFHGRTRSPYISIIASRVV